MEHASARRGCWLAGPMATLSRVPFEKKVHETNPKECDRVLDVFHTRIPTARANQLICLTSV